MSTSIPSLVAAARALFGRGPDVHCAAIITDEIDAEGGMWVGLEVFSSREWSGSPPVEERLDRRSTRVRLSDPTGRLARGNGYDHAPRDLDIVRACDDLHGMLVRELESRRTVASASPMELGVDIPAPGVATFASAVPVEIVR